MTEPQPAQPEVEPTYRVVELQAQAQALGVYPWDVPAVFGMLGKDAVTMAEFEAALDQWHRPTP